MKLMIDPDVIHLFPETKIGVLICRNLDNLTSNKEVFKKLLQMEDEVRNKYQLEEIIKLPKINDWREAYRIFGMPPSSFRPSVESLLRRILQNKQLPNINNIVNIYNLISIKYLLPIGGPDLSQVAGDIKLTQAHGVERFMMLGSKDFEVVKNGEIIYVDNEEVLCRAWNYRESEKTKITTNTKNVLLLLEGLDNTLESEIQDAMIELRTLLNQYCGGRFQEFILSRNLTEIFID